MKGIFIANLAINENKLLAEMFINNFKAFSLCNLRYAHKIHIRHQ